MLLNLLKIRILQVIRTIGDAGILRATLLLVVLLPLLLVFVYQKVQAQGFNHVIAGVALVIVATVHTRRKDYSLIHKLTEHTKLTFYAEYLVLSVPLLITFIAGGQHIHALSYSVLLAPIACIKPQQRAMRTYSFVIGHIPQGMFEWQSGMRRNLIAMIALYTIGLAGVYHIAFAATSALFINVIAGSFNSEYEPRNVIETYGISARLLIGRKVVNHCKCFALLMLPLVAISLIHTEHWLWVLAYFVAGINLQAATVLLKYAYYTPCKHSAMHEIAVAIMLLLTVLLPLSAVVLVANILLYFKSINNLNTYLDAYN